MRPAVEHLRQRLFLNGRPLCRRIGYLRIEHNLADCLFSKLIIHIKIFFTFGTGKELLADKSITAAYLGE